MPFVYLSTGYLVCVSDKFWMHQPIFVTPSMSIHYRPLLFFRLIPPKVGVGLGEKNVIKITKIHRWFLHKSLNIVFSFGNFKIFGCWGQKMGQHFDKIIKRHVRYQIIENFNKNLKNIVFKVFGYQSLKWDKKFKNHKNQPEIRLMEILTQIWMMLTMNIFRDFIIFTTQHRHCLLYTSRCV